VASLAAEQTPNGKGEGAEAEANGSWPKADMTLHQLRIFWAVAHADTLTRAAKQLGLTQPALSQQLAKLESTIGARLFDRTPGHMTLTDAGSFLLRKAELILSNVNEATEGLRQYSDGSRATLRIAGLHSALRVLLPGATATLTERFPEIDLDIHEAAPAEVLELLYGRRVNLGILAGNSVAQASVGFRQVEIATDPYVLAVPDHIDLAGLSDPDHELSPEDTATLNACILFTFGTQHTKRVEQWYAQVLPHHRVIAECRSYETALAMVQADLGICLVPAMTAFDGRNTLPGIRLYRATEPDRTLVAVLPGQYQRVEPYRTFIDALQAAGRAIAVPGIAETPPFLYRAEPVGA